MKCCLPSVFLQNTEVGRASNRRGVRGGRGGGARGAYLVGTHSDEGQFREEGRAAGLGGGCQICHMEAEVHLLPMQVYVCMEALQSTHTRDTPMPTTAFISVWTMMSIAARA